MGSVKYGCGRNPEIVFVVLSLFILDLKEKGMEKIMRVRLKLKPGQRGTKHLLKQYGDRLVCVRYRYDEKSRKRYTTVELIEDEKPWEPVGCKSNSIIQVQVSFDEVDLRQKVKNAGGKWSKSSKTWKIPYKTACDLGIKDRIVS
jgi:hypothetical protein